MSYQGDDIREGMLVYGRNDQQIGRVERVEAEGIHVNGRHIDNTQIGRVVGDRVYLTAVYDEMAMGTGRAGQTVTEDTPVRVPVYEERLDVEKRAGQIGEVEVHKSVTEEEVSVPVELRREQVHVDQVDVDDRPIEAGMADRAFQETTIRVPVRGEEAVVDKEAVVTGEVVIDKQQTVERREVRDTIRREHVDVNEGAYQQARGDFERHFNERRRGQSGDATFDDVESNYRMGFAAGSDERYQGRAFEEVEPDLQRDWEASRGSGNVAGTGRDDWQRLREEIREGYNRTRRTRQ